MRAPGLNVDVFGVTFAGGERAIVGFENVSEIVVVGYEDAGVGDVRTRGPSLL